SAAGPQRGPLAPRHRTHTCHQTALPPPRNHELLQVFLADQEALFAADRIVLVLDREDAVVAVATQRGDVFAPADLAKTRYHVAPPAALLVADPVAPVLLHLGVFRVRVEDAVCEDV